MAKIYPKNIAEAIYEATEGKSGQELTTVLKRSVQIIKNKGILSKSDEILYALQNIFDKKTGTIRIKINTAKNIGHEEKLKIENKIKEKYKAKSIISEFFKKEELIGGTRVEVGDEILDNTYSKKLQELEKFLIQEK